jgi:RHS repeat-associated protein
VRYKPYGEVRGRYACPGTSQVSLEQEPEFTGYETDSTSGLQYAGARYYDPVLGTFLTHDPARQFASPYAYGPWDPINGTDPNGEFWFIPAIVAVVSAFAVAHPIVTAAVVGGVLGGVNSAATGQNIFQGVALGVGLGIVG